MIMFDSTYVLRSQIDLALLENIRSPTLVLPSSILNWEMIVVAKSMTSLQFPQGLASGSTGSLSQIEPESSSTITKSISQSPTVMN